MLSILSNYMNKIITHWLFPLVTVILLFVLHIQDPAITEIARLKQFDREVLLSDDYYNGIIQVKIHRTHVRGLKDND